MIWARPAFLWAMSVGLPAVAIPVILLEEELVAAQDVTQTPAPPLDDASAIMVVLLWFGVPLLFAALCLVGYRGGASIRPLFGRGVLAGVVTVASLLLSALFLLTAFVGTEFPAPHSVPFATWLVAVALYLQLLRAAAVHRSLPRIETDVAAIFE